MAKGKQIWVSPAGDGDWKVKTEGNQKAYRVVENKAEAKDIARSVAKNQGLEMVVQQKDGVIHEKNTYPRGRDKCPPRG
jgi:hypothetical protein